MEVSYEFGHFEDHGFVGFAHVVKDNHMENMFKELVEEEILRV